MNLLEMTDMYVTSVVVTASQIYTYLKSHQADYINYIRLFVSIITNNVVQKMLDVVKKKRVDGERPDLV